MTLTAASHASLRQDEAEARAARIGDVSYDVAIDLRRGSETYRGDVTIRFTVTRPGDGVFMEHRGTRIERLELNGRVVEPSWDGTRLTLPEAQLRPRNEVRLVYENAYDRTGDGFHHYRDPEDGEEYVYSNFEPYDANRMYPCFDQPDIKAVHRLSVTAPDDWVVIGNMREEGAEPAGEDRTRRSFEATPPISTYLFALVAGPYRSVYRDHNGLRLGLHCRKALERHLDPDELFEVTGQGMDFYAALFDRPYAFTKYDQIFCPEFNIGAMENVGAVTITERYVFRDPPTETQREDRAELVLHELAHMWFGNLVTLRWWNDLWLNESFASYVAFLCLAEATRFKDAWKAFNTQLKRWAYRQDQLVTTHPIAGEAPDTDAAFLNFDGITYGKGAAVLKQLVATIGVEGFREGMRRYFRRYAFGNATLADFIAALEAGSRRDLREWSRLWLETPSLNTLAAEWEASDTTIELLRLTQSAPAQYPILRPHTLEVGLARAADGRVDVESLHAAIDGPSVELPEARGLPRPSFVFPNHNDHAYLKVALDPVSLAYVQRNLGRVGDPLLRQLLWLSLWDMVRDQRLSSLEYLTLVRRELPAERDLEIVEATQAAVTTALASYVPEPMREPESHAYFETAALALPSLSDPDRRIIWTRALIASAQSRPDVERLVRLADGEETLDGLSLDMEMRWLIAVRAMAFGLPDADERLAAERERDPSDRAGRMEQRAEAARPDPERKSRVWSRFEAVDYPSLQDATDAMQGFNWPSQREFLDPYVERFFGAVVDVFARTEQRYGLAFVRHLFPAYRAEREVLERSQRVLAGLGDRLPMLVRLLREANDDLARAIACREFAASQGLERRATGS